MSIHEVYSISSDSISMMFSDGEIKTKEADSSIGYGIRALEDGRIGFAYCQKADGISKALEDARRMSRFSVRSGFSFASAAAPQQADIFDKSLDPEDPAALRAYVDEIRDGAESKGGKARVILGVSRAHTEMENTSGFHGAYDKTSFSLYSECMHEDGYGMSFIASCKRPSGVRELGEEAASMASDMRSAKKPESGPYTVVMEPDAFLNILDTLMPSFSGDWKRRGITKLVPGAKAFSEKLTLSEDGLAPASDAQPFDDEGVPSERHVLIDKGVVGSFLYDRETAALEGVQESGACSRARYDIRPSIGSSNIVIPPGDVNDLSELGRIIELHYAHGSHTANSTTGDIGLEASAAFLVENGRRTPLKGFMLTGNIFEWLSNIEGIEKKQSTYGSLIAPRVAFRDVRVVS